MILDSYMKEQVVRSFSRELNGTNAIKRGISHKVNMWKRMIEPKVASIKLLDPAPFSFLEN